MLPIVFLFVFSDFVFGLVPRYRFFFFAFAFGFAFGFALALAFAGLCCLTGFSVVGGGGAGCGIACMRRCISSIDTSSM